MTTDPITLITRDLQEVIGLSQLKEIVGKRPLKIYWRTAPTGEIHLGYMVPLLKIGDFLKAGCQITILLADLHAFLDAMKSTMEQLTARTQYYEIVIRELLHLIGVDTTQLKFIHGTSFQLGSKYTTDMYKFNSIISMGTAKSAGTDVVKQSENPTMTGLLYPVLQCLDEEYLDTDCQFGGVDQRKIFALARDYLPKLGYKKRIHLMNPIVPGLSKVSARITGNDGKPQIEFGKMCASQSNSKVNVLDTPKQLKKKIRGTYCLEGDAEDNSLMILMKQVVFPILDSQNRKFLIQQPEQFGGECWEYKSFEELKRAFETKDLHPTDFKLGVSDFLTDFFEPLREKFDKEHSEIYKKAYSK